MPRTRYLRPGFFRNEALGHLSCMHRLAFAGLWCEADRRGRLEDRPARLRAALFPYDADVDMDAILTDLAQAGFLRRYEADGLRIIQVLHFERHQAPHAREVESVLPPEKSTTQARPRHRLGTTKARPRHDPSTTQVVPEHDLGTTQASPRRPWYLVLDQEQDQDPLPQPLDPAETPTKSPRPDGRAPAQKLMRVTTTAGYQQAAWQVYLKLAHDVLDSRSAADVEADDAASFKTRCGQARIAYDGRIAGQALDAARHIRATRTTLPRADLG